MKTAISARITSLHFLLILSAERLVDQRMSTNWTGVTVKR